MLDYDLTRSTFRYVESLWFRYNDMIDRLRDIEAEEKRLGIYEGEDSFEWIGAMKLTSVADEKAGCDSVEVSDIQSKRDLQNMQSEEESTSSTGSIGSIGAAVVDTIDVEELLSKSTLATQKQKEVIKRNVLAIDTVYSNLPDEYKKVADVRYFRRRNRYNKQAPSWEEVSRRSNYSRRHAMRIRDKMVRDTAMLLGLW